MRLRHKGQCSQRSEYFIVDHHGHRQATWTIFMVDIRHPPIKELNIRVIMLPAV
jgi:hypothetical protein